MATISFEQDPFSDNHFRSIGYGFGTLNSVYIRDVTDFVETFSSLNFGRIYTDNTNNSGYHSNSSNCCYTLVGYDHNHHFMRLRNDILPWFTTQRAHLFMGVSLPPIILPAVVVPVGVFTFSAVAISSGLLLATITSIALTVLSAYACFSLTKGPFVISENVENLHRTDDDVRNKIFADLEKYYHGIGEETPITRSELGEIRIINVSNLDSEERKTTLRNFAGTFEPIKDGIFRAIIVG